MANTATLGNVSLNLLLNNKNFMNSLGGVNKQVTGGLIPSFGKLGAAISAAFSVKAISDFAKASTSAFEKAEQGAMKLYATLSGQGMNLDTADNFISKYVEDGLVSLSEAQTAYANLAAMGMDTSQIENIMNALKDSASAARASGKSIGEAVETAAAGIKQGISNNVDNAGIDKNLAKMEDEYRRIYGIVGDLTQEQKNAAYEMGIMAESTKYMGTAEKMASRYSGAIARVKASWESLKASMGSIFSHVLIPIMNGLTTVINLINNAAKSFANFLDMVTGTTSIKDMFSGTTETTNEISETVSDGVSSIGGAAAGAAKKILRAVAPFDKLNKIADSSSGGGGGGGSSTTTTADSEKTDNKGSHSIGGNKIDEIAQKIKHLKELWSEGWNGGFQADISKLQDNLGRIKKSLTDIFTDEDVMGSSLTLFDSYVKLAGQLAGSLASVTTSMSVWLSGSIAQTLENNTTLIEDWITTMNTEMVDMNTTAGDLLESIANIFTVFEGSEAENFLSSILSSLLVIGTTIEELALKLTNDTFQTFAKPIIDNVDKIKESIKNTFSTFQDDIDYFKDLFSEYGQKFTDLYNNHISPVLEKFKESFSSCFSILLDIYNEYFLPIMDGLGGDFKRAIERDILPTLDTIISSVASVCDFIVSIWDEGIHPLMETITTVVGYVISSLIAGISALCITFGKLGSPITLITSLFSRFKTTGQEVATAFQGIGAKITEVFNGIGSSVKTAINGVISVINSMIDSINQLKIDIPNPFGEDKHIGFNIPHIPQLAQGGYVKANNPQLAIIGDNRRYGEIVANDKQLSDLGSSIINGVVGAISGVGNNQPIYLTVNIGDEDITDIVAVSMNKYQKRTGKRIF